MRLTTLCKRLLRLEGVRLAAVELEGEAGQERVVVELVRPQRRLLRCPRCGFCTPACYDRSLRTLRHLDVLRRPCLLRLEVCRLDCESLRRRQRGAAVRRYRQPVPACVRAHRCLARTRGAEAGREPAEAGRLGERRADDRACAGGGDGQRR
jgi:hypothetical protein